jgi:hypothetical protein
MPDGRTFLIDVPPDVAPPAPITVVINWAAGLLGSPAEALVGSRLVSTAAARP